MSTPVRFFSLFVQQAGSAINGFCTQNVVTELQQRIRDGSPFILQMKGDRGYSVLCVSPDRGGLSVRCNIAEEGEKYWETVPVDANGDVCDPSAAAQVILPSAAKKYHIEFLGSKPANQPGPTQEKPGYVPDP